MMKMNEARKLNNKAVMEENERVNDPLYERRKNKEQFFIDKKTKEKVLLESGLNKDKSYIFETALQSENSRKRSKKNTSFGWDVFNEDSLYRAYHKRLKNLPDSKELEAMTEEERRNLLTEDLEK